MIYLISFIVGFLNGLFASGAGQVLVFYLIFIMHLDTYKARALSVSALSIGSIFVVFGYSKMINFEISKVSLVVVIALITGVIGTKLMKKIPVDILNLISGILIVVLTAYEMIFKG